MPTARKRKPKADPAPKAAAGTAPPDPWQGRGGSVWCGPAAGVRVNEWTVLQVAAALACVRYIATSIAQIDYNVYEALPGGGKKYLPDHPADWILDKQANPETPAVVFWETMLLWAALWGDGYAEIERDYAGRPLWLWQLPPDRVELRRADGRQVYLYHEANGGTTALDPADVFHLRGLSWDGQLGLRLAHLCREAFGGPIAAQDFANAFFANDATPGFALTTEQALSKAAVDRLVASHEGRHAGPGRSHRVAVYEEGVKPFKLGASAEETQLVAVQQFYVEQVARVFGVPLTKIGHLLHSATRANMEEEDWSAYKQCLRPWARKVECEADIKLFGRVSRGRLFTLHDFSVLLRGNTEQLTAHATQLVDRGILDIDEARDLFDLNPLGEAAGGKKRLFPMNFTTLERAGEDPKPGGAGSGDSPGTGSSNAPMPARDNPAAARAATQLARAAPDRARVSATFAQLLADVYARLLRVESDKAQRAANKGQLKEHVKAYYQDAVGCTDNLAFAVKLIEPVVAGLFLAAGRQWPRDARRYATDLAARHLCQSQTDLEDGIANTASWADRANQQAARDIGRLWEESK